ncbi:NUDIX hydrolase [Brevundimonas sp. PAMC22021]|uniref:NUDIX domain-containing protein n=1 Tax=Brevundimonas sp. PAMC22021 TaxID=2861285 RepID=UPI001C634FBB|nr:NUDIX hydrolase [Brevundimonas sp. PAMC22021]QYF87805.1 NUDIX hydrolase [Brevundimonas sp. PAMC22021]
MTDDAAPEPRWASALSKPLAWRAIAETPVFENPWMRLIRYQAVAPSGAETEYTVMRPKNVATGVLPIHDDGMVVLVGQQRFARMNYSWEMPEGGAEPGEDPAEGVRRELAEEAGLVADSWSEPMVVELSNSITDEVAHTWIAWDLRPSVQTAADATEVLAVVRAPFRQVLEAIGQGAIRDVMTVAAVYRAYHMAREGLLPTALAHAMLQGV